MVFHRRAADGGLSRGWNGHRHGFRLSDKRSIAFFFFFFFFSCHRGHDCDRDRDHAAVNARPPCAAGPFRDRFPEELLERFLERFFSERFSEKFSENQFCGGGCLVESRPEPPPGRRTCRFGGSGGGGQEGGWERRRRRRQACR